VGNCNIQRKDVLGEISITLRKAISYQFSSTSGCGEIKRFTSVSGKETIS